jgi:hypothetical protein
VRGCWGLLLVSFGIGTQTQTKLGAYLGIRWLARSPSAFRSIVDRSGAGRGDDVGIRRWKIWNVRGEIAGGLDLVGGSPPVGNRVQPM